MAIPQLGAFPPPPLLGQTQAVFNTNASNTLSYMSTWVTEMNAVSTAIDSATVAIGASEANIATLSDNVVSAVNNKGNWSALTGALNVPATVNHSGATWSLNLNIADVTLSEPTLINTDWTNISIGQADLDLKESIADNDVKLATKQDTLVSATNIKTVNGASILGSGDIATPNDTLAIASTAEAQAGTDNTKAITPLRLHETMIGSDSQQTWQNVSGSRALGTTYTNNTGRPIQVVFTFGAISNDTFVEFYTNGIKTDYQAPAANTNGEGFDISRIIPDGDTYRAVLVSGALERSFWTELR